MWLALVSVLFVSFQPLTKTVMFCVLLAALLGVATFLIIQSRNEDEDRDTESDVQVDAEENAQATRWAQITLREPPSTKTPAPPPAVTRGRTTQETITDLETSSDGTTGSATETPETMTVEDTESIEPNTTSDTTTTRRTTSPTTTTTPPAPLKELICTVGHSAMEPAVYPPDRYCDYLYYTEVVVQDERIRAAKSPASWNLFMTQARKYRNIKPGAAFDFRHISVKKLDSVRADMALLTQNKIRHHGLLNVFVHVKRMTTVLRELKAILQKLKEVQVSHQRGRIVVAMGLYDYSRPYAYENYKEAFKEVVNNFKADTVIAISSTGLMGYDDTECYAVPPVALRARNPIFPSMMQQRELLSHRFGYSNPQTVVGLSYQLGALLYLLKTEAPNVLSVPYAECEHRNITSMDVICRVGPPEPVETGAGGIASKNIHSYAGRAWANSTKLVYLSENLSFKTLLRNLIGPGLHFRSRSAWLVFDVHLEDHSGNCTESFAALKQLCEAFKSNGEPKVPC